MRKLTLILISITFTALHLFAQENLFWVNGAGNWNDITHWATTSGGNGGAIIPTQNSNVFIDANSALSNNNAVIIKSTAIIKSLEISTPMLLKGKGSLKFLKKHNCINSKAIWFLHPHKNSQLIYPLS